MEVVQVQFLSTFVIGAWRIRKPLKKLQRVNKRSRLLKWLNIQLLTDPTVENYLGLLKSRENCPYFQRGKEL